MEIINYSENTAYSVYKPLYKNSKSGSFKNFHKDEYSFDEMTFKKNYMTFRGRFIIVIKGIKKVLSYSWVLVSLAFLCCIPKIVSYVMYLIERTANTVDLEASQGEQLDVLDSAMFDFALDKTSFYDEEGNILGNLKNNYTTERVFKEPVSYSSYTVKSGDTISGISLKFGLSNISTIIAVNNIPNVKTLSVGQHLTIPSMDGLFYTVKENDTIYSIADSYGISFEEIVDVNDLTSESLALGQKVFIPGAKMDAASLQSAMGEVFIWPIKASYRITSRFGARADPFTGVASNHTGIDMACPKGTAIRASMSGTVIYSGYSNIYGNYVIIKHTDGYQTLYGHMSRILTSKGAYVSQGSTIGLVGSTGYSTGPHLHFSVYKNGKLVDPMTVLK